MAFRKWTGTHVVRQPGPKKKAPSKQLRTSEGGLDPTVMVAIARSHEHGKTLRTLIIALFVVCGLLALYPATSALAGQNTNVNVNVALGLTVAFSVVGGGAGIWGYKQKKKFDDANTRRKELEGRLRVANEELAAANRRIEGIERDLDGLRRDKERR